MKKPPAQRGSRHISQLKPTDRARADQLTQFALLAIVQSQGKTVSIPYEKAEQIFDTHRLKIVLNDGAIELSAEKQDSRIVVPDKEIIQ